MALSEAQKTQLINSLLASRKTSVDGLTVERRTASDIREAIDVVCDDLEATSPASRMHITSFDPPGALDG